MQNPITFTIIMPCYNSEAYVSDAVESLIKSTYSNWKLLAINDGSTDRTLEILNEFAKTDNRIQVYSKENGGYCSAINYGLDRITGDYFLMMGSDDRLGDTLFSEIVNNIEDELPDMIGFRALRIVDGVNTGIDQDADFKTKAYAANTTIKEYECRYPEHSRIFFVRDTCKCFKSSLLGDLRYFGKYGFDADGIFSCLFAHKARSFLSVPVDGYYWTLRPDSLSAKTTIAMDFDRLENWIAFINAIRDYRTSDITEHEIRYLSIPQHIGIKLLGEIDKIDIDKNRRICRARRVSVAAEKKFCKKKNRSSLKYILYAFFPELWNRLYLFKYPSRIKKN